MPGSTDASLGAVDTLVEGRERPPRPQFTRHYDERALASLLVQIAGINAFNRLNVATRQPSGDWVANFA